MGQNDMAEQNESKRSQKKKPTRARNGYVGTKGKQYAEAIAAQIKDEEKKAVVIEALTLSEEDMPDTNPAVVMTKKGKPSKHGANLKRWTPENDEDRAFVKQLLLELLTEYRRPAVTSDEELAERFSDYYDRCAREGRTPTWEEACLSTGYSAGRLDAWELGVEPGIGIMSREIVKKAKAFQQGFDAKLVVAGRMNFLAYCYRSKVYYGMRDNTELPVERSNPLGNANLTPKQLQERYLQGLNAPEYEDKTRQPCKRDGGDSDGSDTE